MSTQKISNKDLLIKAGTPVTVVSHHVEGDGTETTDRSNSIVLLEEDVFCTRWTPERKIVVRDVPRDTTQAWMFVALWAAFMLGATYARTFGA